MWAIAGLAGYLPWAFHIFTFETLQSSGKHLIAGNFPSQYGLLLTKAWKHFCHARFLKLQLGTTFFGKQKSDLLFLKSLTV